MPASTGRRANLVPDVEQLVERLTQDGVVVLNYDEPFARQVRPNAAPLSVSVDTDGTRYGADLTAYNLILALDKTGFDLRYGKERHIARWVPLLGAHQLYAALMGVAVGLSFGIELEEALQRLTTLQPLPGRMRPLEGPNGALIIDDTHTSNPSSLARALAYMGAMRPQPSMKETQTGQISPRGRLHVVLGDLADPGSDAQFNLMELGKQLTQVAATITTQGDSAAALARAALDHGSPAQLYARHLFRFRIPS
ncbi:MAG: hypothetical protein HC915_05735 [Anaerolineae bacterium]|nr:hypothetical protein [Anaerolineae bacterium]